MGGTEPGLKRALGLTDVTLYFVTATSSLQWVATAAAAGPSALTVWLIGALTMFVPLSVCTVWLASRHPDQGGLYVWTGLAFGPFAAFLTGWSYWTSNLPYFAGMLYFAAGSALWVTGGGAHPLDASPAWFISFAVGTLAVLVSIPYQQTSALYGVMQAIDHVGDRLGLGWVTPLAASFTVVTCLGSASAWLGSVARIPFVAGIDNFLPTSFGRLHPRYGSPANALTTQTAIAMALAVMGQAGTSVKGAYEVLVNLMVITQMLPFLILFASAIQLARGAPAAYDLKIPGGRATVVATALVGLFTTLGAIVVKRQIGRAHV